MTADDSGSKAKVQEALVDPKLRPLIRLAGSPSEKPLLIGNKCKSCGEYFFPKRVICPNCLKEDVLEDVLLSNKGKLYTYCIVKVAPVGFDAPYAVGYVDLPEGLRIFSPLAECDKERLKIDMDVELIVDKIREDEAGQPVYGYKFKSASP